MILWGMGISQHVHGTDNARCLIALCLMTGQIGRPGTGLHPLRGQNNVQGASDSGLIPMMFPDYQRVDNPEARARFEKLWGTTLDPQAGPDRGRDHGCRCSTARSAACTSWARTRRCRIPTRTTRARRWRSSTAWSCRKSSSPRPCYLADVILPATAWPEKDGTVTNTDRMVQLGRQALDAPGDARPDLWIIQEIARRLGLDWNYSGPTDVFNEMRKAMQSIAGITWERLEAESCGHLSVRAGRRSRAAGGVHRRIPDRRPGARSSCRPTSFPADERPDAEYPVRADHRAPARALAHRRDDAARRRCSMRSSPSRRRSLHPLDLDAIGAQARRRDHRGIAARHHFALRARRRRHAARRGVHPVLLLRGGGEPADQSGARSVRQDSRVQVLRGEASCAAASSRRVRATAAGRRWRRSKATVGTDRGPAARPRRSTRQRSRAAVAAARESSQPRHSGEERTCRYPISRSPRRRRCSASPRSREKLGIPEERLEPYGHYKAKVSLDYIDTPEGQARTAS